MYTYYCVANKSLALWDKMGYSTCRLLVVACCRRRSVAKYLRGLIVFQAHWNRFWSDYKSQPWNYIFLSLSSVHAKHSCCFGEIKIELSDASLSWALNFRMTSGYWPFVIGFSFHFFLLYVSHTVQRSQNYLVCRWWWWCEQDFHVRC